jgi:hypothetical protein
MSDSYYQERARRRTRYLLIGGAIAVVAIVLAAVIWSLYRDACTGSFERSPTAVVSSYLEAVGRGDAPAAQACWQHEAYYELEAGCSEICLSKVYGAQFTIVDIAAGEPNTTPEGRHNLEATVTIACTEGGENHTADILLDSVEGDPPWKHWTIVHSTFGGSVVEPWCK